MILRKQVWGLISKKKDRPLISYKFSTNIYSQKAWLGEPWLKLNKKSNLNDSLHGGWMIFKGILPFSYDSYQHICGKAIEFQQKLKNEDILMLINLGVKYQIKLQPFVKHIQNELFLRLYQQNQEEMIKYDLQIENDLKQLYNNLQKNSMDFYSILKQSQQQQGEQFDYDELQDDNVRQKNVQQHKRTEFKAEKIVQQDLDIIVPSITYKQKFNNLTQISELLRQWNTTNIDLLVYLLESMTIKMESQDNIESNSALAYLKFITFVCQQLFKQYQGNKGKYTPRSIKRIYKLQYFYYYEHLRQLDRLAGNNQISSDFIQEIVKQYVMFPLKKRQLRRKIGLFVSEQIKKLQLNDRQDLIQKLIDMNGKDNKMKNTFRKYFDLPIIQEKKSEKLEDNKSEEEGHEKKIVLQQN